MSTFDDPNREALGLAPIWTGAGDEPEVDPELDEEPEPEALAKGKRGELEEADDK